MKMTKELLKAQFERDLAIHDKEAAEIKAQLYEIQYDLIYRLEETKQKLVESEQKPQ